MPNAPLYPLSPQPYSLTPVVLTLMTLVDEFVAWRLAPWYKQRSDRASFATTPLTVVYTPAPDYPKVRSAVLNPAFFPPTPLPPLGRPTRLWRAGQRSWAAWRRFREGPGARASLAVVQGLAWAAKVRARGCPLKVRVGGPRARSRFWPFSGLAWAGGPGQLPSPGPHLPPPFWANPTRARPPGLDLSQAPSPLEVQEAGLGRRPVLWPLLRFVAPPIVGDQPYPGPGGAWVTPQSHVNTSGTPMLWDPLPPRPRPRTSRGLPGWWGLFSPWSADLGIDEVHSKLTWGLLPARRLAPLELYRASVWHPFRAARPPYRWPPHLRPPHLQPPAYDRPLAPHLRGGVRCLPWVPVLVWYRPPALSSGLLFNPRPLRRALGNWLSQIGLATPSRELCDWGAGEALLFPPGCYPLAASLARPSWGSRCGRLARSAGPALTALGQRLDIIFGYRWPHPLLHPLNILVG